MSLFAVRNYCVGANRQHFNHHQANQIYAQIANYMFSSLLQMALFWIFLPYNLPPQISWQLLNNYIEFDSKYFA